MSLLADLLAEFAVPAGAASPIRLPLERHGLVALWRKWGYQCGAEVGVDLGTFSAAILAGLPGVRLFGVDPWQAYPEYDDVYDQARLDGRYRQACLALRDYPNCTLRRQTSLEAAVQFAPGSLDFVYIDGNHAFDYAMTDIIAWSWAVRSGGCVAGHDYLVGTHREGRTIHFGVRPAVHAYIGMHKLAPWFLTTERVPSWFWIKP